MTRNARALLLALALLTPFVATHAHADAPWGAQDARDAICFDGAAWDCDGMVAIARRESGYQPWAVNRDCGNDGTYRLTCWGLLQVLSPCECGLLDATENVRRAYLLYLDGGISTHWRATQ